MSDNTNWKLKVAGSLLNQPVYFTLDDFESLSDTTFTPAPYLDPATTNVVRFTNVLNKLSLTDSPSHVVFYGSDQFIAEVVMAELDAAFFLFKEDGKPLNKGYPIRLYVPDGSSKCLNIKSVIGMEPVRYKGKDLNKPSSFGFNNTLSPEELKKGDSPKGNSL